VEGGQAVLGTEAALGIDLGTSRLKALLATPDGEILGRGSAVYPVVVPAKGHAETDPGDWWRAATTAVRAALADAGPGVEVAGLAVAGQMHGVVLADAAGTPARPAILWLDRRAAAEAVSYAQLPAELTARLGNRPSPGMAGPILRWLTEHEPRIVRRARWALQPKDWLRLRLTGEPATDPTDASGTLLFDLQKNTWASDLVRALQIPEDMLPGIREPAEIAGRLLEDPANELGLRPGIPVAVGAADTAASLYSVCYREDGAVDYLGNDALLTLGTGGQWIAPQASFRPTAATNLFRAAGGGYYRLAASQNVGATLDWVRDLLGVSWDDLYGTAARPWRPDTPLFLPYLAAERWDGTAKGAWTGLTLAHGKDDLLRAALEGVAFLLRERLEDLREAGHDPKGAVIGGGGTRHPAWRQLLADVLALPLHPAATSWLSATGAARLAATAAVGETWPAARPTASAAPVTPAAPSGTVAAAYERFCALPSS
jgi:xylulokinase